MSTQEPTTIYSQAAVSPRSATRPPRVLSCVLCQQRKVRCNREFPCFNCTRAGVQCIPAAGARPRRRRFPERELLERLRRYEALLRQNNIPFDPLHTPTAESPCQSECPRGSSTPEKTTESTVGTDQLSSEKKTVKCEYSNEAKNFWYLMNQMSLSPSDGEDTDENDSNHPQADLRETGVKKAWDQIYQSNEQNLLFGSCNTNVDISTLHPDQVQIFRLWQVYLDNVNPLLKVTHTPTLQARIIDAAGDVTNISPTLEALMFSIYCVSILSLGEDQCCAIFRTPREDLLKRYQFACQQALLKCGVLRTSSVECLTALYLYLVSVRSSTDPRSVSSMLGVAIRIAQRMGLENEAINARCTALEGEMRRRLWWSLTIFDHRISEVTDYKTTMLIPTWDCRAPLNVNDFDIRPEMKVLPQSHDGPTEALFTVVRNQVGDFIRHSAFHLDFTNPSLKAIVKDTPHGGGSEGDRQLAFAQMIEDRYLRLCNPENPLHFMTIWRTRGQLAKNRLLEYYSRYASVPQTDEQRDIAISYALRVIECDTKLMTSPLTKGYLWFTEFQFPFPAYIYILKDLQKRPTVEHADRIWRTMSDNCEARSKDMQKINRFFDFFGKFVLEAWEAREAVSTQVNKPLQPPGFVSRIKEVAQTLGGRQGSDPRQPKGGLNTNTDHLSMTMPTDFGSHDLLYSMEGQGFPNPELGGYPGIPGQVIMDAEVNQSDWTTIDWYPMHAQNW
ncbi:putative C6 transcription factor [Aspergillus bombycis]|uniref:Putative C6 transcription factor n=1 Tax=Aspergillus bombycis TaxID=109264 RepID=A0A1F8AG30_9EURO|nr:putative C6 transcription factor [Aspergillus bombycis]OGM50622.1 putative C6 transcription factor [Aspergillus bombycis]